MLFRIKHETRSTYSQPVSETVFEAQMPPSTEDQTVLSHRLNTTPRAPVMAYRDGFGNRVELFNLSQPYTELVVDSASLVRTHRRPVDRLLDGLTWPPEGLLSVDVLEFLQPTPLVNECRELDALAAEVGPPAGLLLDLLGRLLDAIHDRMTYEKCVTTTRTPVCEALILGKGVCQDFSHLFLGLSRALGLPARYVSGYLHHPGEVETHSWCQVWAGEPVGWVDVDPTTREIVGERHVLVAVGRDYSDVPPNRGIWKGQATERIEVSVRVEPIDRVPAEWNEWYPLGFRPVAFTSRSSRIPMPLASGPFAAYPNQQPSRPGFHQQQAEQQQQ